MLKLSLICEYAKCTPQSRNFCEGEDVINAQHIIVCGLLKGVGADFGVHNVYAIVLQTSAPSDNPHTVKGNVSKDLSIIFPFTCTCKDGDSGRCKHVMAVLLFCNRNNFNTLEHLSIIDVNCARSPGQAGTAANYRTAPLETLCCVKPRKFQPPAIDEDDVDIHVV